MSNQKKALSIFIAIKPNENYQPKNRCSKNDSDNTYKNEIGPSNIKDSVK